MRGLFLLFVALPGCALDWYPAPETEPDPNGCNEDVFEIGADRGHPDPFGAKAAGEARAARMLDVSGVAQPAHGRQPIQDGDFILVNEHIAVVIEDRGLSDGYSRFGGEILTVDEVGSDGRPLGKSRFLETLVGIGVALPDPSSVSVLRDGSDGGEAVVRVFGRTKPIPFLDGPLSTILPADHDGEVAIDYALAPGEPRLRVRISIANITPDPLDFGEIKAASDEMYGFFHASQNQIVTQELGFKAEGMLAWVGFVADAWSFAWRSAHGPLEVGIEEGGFSLFAGPGYLAEPCSITKIELAEVIAGGPGYDGLREALREVDGDPSWRAIDGQVTDSAGAPLEGAYVHALDEDDLYLSRAQSAADGSFTIHAPPAEGVRLVATQRGFHHDGVDHAPGDPDATLAFAPHARIHVVATAATGGALPVRIQVIPTSEPSRTPEEWGVAEEEDGRLHQEFAMQGDATMVVPPGEHRVVVTRGYEYEIHDQTVSLAAGETAEVAAVLEHSVDTAEYLCADFHIHSFLSADSSDPIEFKVRGAVADGLDIPVSSEHEWVIDFQPVIEALGLQDFAFGMPSSELTTFRYGHFGVVPLLPKPGEYNNGAIDWLYKTPAETFAAVDERPERPALIVNHPSGGGFQAYFSSMVLDKETGEPGYPDLWSDNFDAIEVFNDDSFDDEEDAVAHWFALLNAGLRRFAVGNSDSHHLVSEPTGYPRTCFHFGHDNPRLLDHDAVRDAVIAGRGNISGGLFMTVVGPGGELPGDSVAAGARTFAVRVESPSWIDAQELEVYVNGALRSTETLLPLGPGPANRYVNMVPLDLASGDWVLFHARGVGDLTPLHPGRKPFAVSNPIFVE